MKDIRLKLEKLETKIGLSKNSLVVIEQINANTLKYRNKLYEIPQSLTVSEYLDKKFPGKKIIIDDIY